MPTHRLLLPPPDPREARLPAWARELLAAYRREAERAVRANEEARLATAPEESDAVLAPYSEPPIGLGRNALVRFLLSPEEEDPTDYVDVRVVRERRYRHAPGDAAPTQPVAVFLEVRGGRALTLGPQVTNLLRVTTSPHGGFPEPRP